MHNPKIKVLDHGFVRLVEHMGNDLSIVRSARVSYNAEWRSGEDAGKDEKLIRYLMKNRHTSPFESVVFNFEIKCPIFIARQWHRHRTWAYNEVSARYTELPEEFYIPDGSVVGLQSSSNKQCRDIGEGPRDQDIFCEALTAHSEEGFRQYKVALESGIPRELARCFLPMNTYTHFFGKADLHNLFHFLRLRLHAHAQWEIQQYAVALLQIIEPIVPVAADAFKETLKV